MSDLHLEFQENSRYPAFVRIIITMISFRPAGKESGREGYYRAFF